MFADAHEQAVAAANGAIHEVLAELAVCIGGDLDAHESDRLRLDHRSAVGRRRPASAWRCGSHAPGRTTRSADDASAHP
jgi:hypothetical protein